MTLIRKRWLASAAAAVLASAVLTGCGSSTSSGGTTTGTGSTADLAKAAQEVASLEAVTTDYPVPTAGVSGVSGFKGRTVYYIPLVQDIPGFVLTAGAMKQALGTAGLSQQVCNGEAQPSAISACIQQAIAADAAGIVLDAIPYGMAQNELEAAKAKGIPVIIADQIAPSGTTDTDQVTYVPGAIAQPSAIAWWLIDASKGSAKAIIAEETDSPSSEQYVTTSLAIYKQYCPGCDITVKDITASNDSLLASDTSSNILTDPGVQYYYTEFEDSLQPTIQGIQQSGRSSDVALAEAGGSVDGLGLLKDGSDSVKAVVAVDETYAGYAETDEILRMMTKSTPVAEPFPTRLFTSANIGSIQVTTAAQASGGWFGSDSFESSFATLWGVG